MKKYIKPTVEVVELSVKESLSALPSGLKKDLIGTQRAAYAATLYKLTSSTGTTTN